MTGHARAAARSVADTARARWHDQALWSVREKRDRAASAVPRWEDLRTLAARIKQHTLARLPDYLEQFESRAKQLGVKIHWAETADDHNRIVLQILEDHRVRRVVKSKSMLTEECGLNPFLEAHGIEVVDTDLGERIVQLRGERPSHIVLPAIHLKREDVGKTFASRLGIPYSDDPQVLTEAARSHLREKFLQAEAGITGVNFAVAETGGIVVCTNEGNVDLGTALPPLHIACMGLEKVIPRTEDLAVFLRLLARSATGQAITSYTSHFHGPAPDGELHVVLVDNGRARLRGDREFDRSLRCVRCGACMNTCPVYRRSGGHSYGTTVPGPIGSILGPVREPARHRSLPYACTLCGSCTDVCPVEIDLHDQLRALRSRLASERASPVIERIVVAAAGRVMRSPRLYACLGRLLRWAMAWLPRVLIGRLWGRGRAMPLTPASSFQAQWAAERTKGGKR